jgi:hypothetical protein
MEASDEPCSPFSNSKSFYLRTVTLCIELPCILNE